MEKARNDGKGDPLAHHRPAPGGLLVKAESAHDGKDFIMAVKFGRTCPWLECFLMTCARC